MKRIVIVLALCGLGAGILIAQSINLKAGLFFPSLQSDLWETNLINLTFNKSDMINVYYGAEFEFFLNRYSSLSLEIGSFKKEVHSRYKDYTYPNGSPLFQDISLHITPIEASIKIYPIGHRFVFFPFIGAGAGLYAWTYRQYGNFVIFPEAYIEEGFAETRTFSFGFNGRAGLVFRFHPRVALAVEGKYQYLRGRLSKDFEGFELLDLGGITATFGITIYFQ